MYSQIVCKKTKIAKSRRRCDRFLTYLAVYPIYYMYCTSCIVFFALQCSICIVSKMHCGLWIIFLALYPSIIFSAFCMAFYASYFMYFILCIVFYALCSLQSMLCTVIYAFYSLRRIITFPQRWPFYHPCISRWLFWLRKYSIQYLLSTQFILIIVCEKK